MIATWLIPAVFAMAGTAAEADRGAAAWRPLLRGAIDVADQTRVAGWAVAPEAPEVALEVQLFIDGKLVASKLADEERVDLVRSGVRIVELGGATNAGRFLQAHRVAHPEDRVAGLYDEAEERFFRRGLERAGFGPVPDRQALERF